VKGVSIICHGKSSPEAIKNGILAGLRAVESKMNAHIGEQVTA
jgi:fatty acid/phospholipid biosynthesis enzyme